MVLHFGRKNSTENQPECVFRGLRAWKDVDYVRTCRKRRTASAKQVAYQITGKKVQVGKDQEKAQSEKDSHSKNRGGKKQTNNQALIP